MIKVRHITTTSVKNSVWNPQKCISEMINASFHLFTQEIIVNQLATHLVK